MSALHTTNPYIGPRTFTTEEGNLYFGREREARDLLSVVITERLVLFYAQSGAGKSSLINTRLIPGLIEQGEYRILPVGRLLGEAVKHEEVENIYIYNLVTSLIKRKIDGSMLAGLTLSGFLAGLDYDEGEGYFYNEHPALDPAEDDVAWKYVLVIDQFEELFTSYPEEWQKREDFFRQVAQAMEDYPNLRFVLTMREDYVALLEPYTHLLPGRFRCRYYMERLGQPGALEAVQGPAVRMGRPFVPEVAQKLVNDLSTVQVRQPDETLEPQPGQYVEPVQLQVVCYSLWEQLPPDCTEINQEHLNQFVGDVDQALGNYYAARVEAVADQMKQQGREVSEHDIREWFGKKLITSDGIRNMVAQEKGSRSGGLDDVVVQEFVRRGDLVRAEKRGGATFYELTHDRLVDPILQNNREWLETKADLLQRRVGVWLAQGRSNSLLLRGRDLRKARKLAKSRSLTDDERVFLETSVRTERNRSLLLAATALALVIMMALTLYAVDQSNKAVTAKNEANIQKSTAQAAATDAIRQEATAVSALTRVANANQEKSEAEEEVAINQVQMHQARIQQLSAQAELAGQEFPSKSLLLSLEAIKLNADAAESINATARQALLDGLANVQGVPLAGNTNSILVLKFSPDGRWLATGAGDGSIKVWERDDDGFKKMLAASLETGDRDIGHLAFTPDSQVLTGVGISGKIYLWKLENDQEFKPLPTLETDLPGIDDIKISPDGHWLVAGNGQAEKILLWDLRNIAQGNFPGRYDFDISIIRDEDQNSEFLGTFGFGFSSNGFQLLTWNSNHYQLFDLTAVSPYKKVDNSYLFEVLVLEPDGYYTSSESESLEPGWAGFINHDNYIVVAFPEQSSLLESGIRQWSVDTFLQNPWYPALQGYGHQWMFSSNVVSPDSMLYISSSDSHIRIRNYKTSSDDINLVGHEGPVSDLLVSQDGRWLVSASALRPSANVTGDGSFWIWDLQAADVQKSGQKYKFNNDASAIDIDPLGEWVAAGSENQQLRLIPFDVDLKEAYKTKYGVNLDALNETQMEECVGLSPDGRWLKYINSNGTGFLLETKSKTRESVEEEICESYFSPNGRWLIAPVSDGIRIYDLQGSKIGTPQKYLTNPHTYPQHWFFSGDETLFITDDGTRDTSGDWTPEQNTATYMIRLQEQRQVRPDPAIRSFAVSPDSKWLAGVSADGKGDFAIYDLSAGKPAENVTVLLPAAAKLGLPEEAEELVYAVVQQEMDQDVVHFSPDSQWVTLTTCADGRKIHVWNLLAKNPASSEIVVALPESKDCSGEVEISYGENASWLGMLVDGVVKLIDISRTPAREIDIQKLVTSGAIQQISFSPDGRWLALLDELGQVRAIDLRDANLTAIQLNPLFYKIDKIGFDKGSHVLSGSTTLGNTLIWEMDDPYAFPLVSNGGSYTNSDGQWLFSLSYDQLLEAICPQIGRNLSRSEWLLYGFSEDYRATCPQFPTE